MMQKRFKVAIATIAAAGTFGAATAFFGDIFTDVLKIGGIGLLVDRFGPDINKALNKLQNFDKNEERLTKVVPILSVSNRGKNIGAAQVMGPRAQVNKVTAVAQVETDFARVIRVRAMIPVESKNVVQNIRRVVGVGISGLVDIKV
jgi:hypothetical protein